MFLQFRSRLTTHQPQGRISRVAADAPRARAIAHRDIAARGRGPSHPGTAPRGPRGWVAHERRAGRCQRGALAHEAAGWISPKASLKSMKMARLPKPVVAPSEQDTRLSEVLRLSLVDPRDRQAPAVGTQDRPPAARARPRAPGRRLDLHDDRVELRSPGSRSHAHASCRSAAAAVSSGLALNARRASGACSRIAFISRSKCCASGGSMRSPPPITSTS